MSIEVVAKTHKIKLLIMSFIVLICFMVQPDVFAQGPCGGKPCPRITVSHPIHPPRPSQPGPKRPTTVEPTSPTNCEDSDLVVVCGMPGCKITVEGRNSKAKFTPLSTVITDDLGGYTFQLLGNQQYQVRVSKPGYESFTKDVGKIACHDQQELKASLLAKPVTLRLRTDPPESDIYLESQKQPYGKSDPRGLFSYLLSKPTLLIEARKPGYLSATKTVFLAPEVGSQEILLSLEPIKATLRITANVETAHVSVDANQTLRSVTEKLLLSPGKHTITVKALGYATAEFEVSVQPEETITKNLNLERLPINALQEQAGTFFSNRAYDDVVKLAEYILEADSTNAAANRLLGLVYLERANLPDAESHFERALAGGETVMLPVRRHAGEKFELNKGHDTCDAYLILSKTELEFKSTRNATENFRVPYTQLQVTGIQLKSGVASYLKTKVTVNGKSRDYNFYSFDRELSQAGKPYLEMIQRLMRSH
ncbi:MAG TPA: PEGA domain-containing protein [Pyrinomonadaceae bacterium]|nr:PEGA domain-containing protein [Pyrinomonadaceae bacterium]